MSYIYTISVLYYMYAIPEQKTPEDPIFKLYQSHKEPFSFNSLTDDLFKSSFVEKKFIALNKEWK